MKMTIEEADRRVGEANAEYEAAKSHYFDVLTTPLPGEYASPEEYQAADQAARRQALDEKDAAKQRLDTACDEMLALLHAEDAKEVPA